MTKTPQKLDTATTITAECMELYGIGGNDDDDDEDEFVGEDDNDDDDLAGEFENMKGENNEAGNDVVLHGSLYINEEGRLVYSGTWTMRRDLDKLQKDENNSKQEQELQESPSRSLKSSSSPSPEGKQATVLDKQRKRKFKLKSKKQNNRNDRGGSECTAVVNLNNPLLMVSSDGDHGCNDEKEAMKKSEKDLSQCSRTILFDGFFATDETDTIQPYRKVKERDVEVTFSLFNSSKSNNAQVAENNIGDVDVKNYPLKQRFQVKGRGSNEFGAFSVEGVYTPTTTPITPMTNGKDQVVNGEGDNDDKKLVEKKEVEEVVGEKGKISSSQQALICRKWYTPTIASKKRRQEQLHNKNWSEDDYEISGEDEGADYEELVGLHEEADMSVEELRKRYYGGELIEGGKGGEGDNESARKKSKVIEDDCDGCGF